MENVKTLPGVYAFTGNDYIPAFYRKGKRKPINIINNNPKFVDVFTIHGDVPLNNEITSLLEESACHLHAHTKQTDKNEVIKLRKN